MENQITFDVQQQREKSFVFRISGRCPVAAAVSTVEISRQGMEELNQEIQYFLEQKDAEGYWESDIPGLGETPCITMTLLPGAEPEQVVLELYMELDDGGDFSRHICRFYVHTARHQLQSFAGALQRYSDFVPGFRFSLEGN